MPYLGELLSESLSLIVDTLLVGTYESLKT